MGVPRFQRLFRAAAEVEVHKDDLKRFSDFVNHKLYDLLIRAEAAAKANSRDVIAPGDLPITKGLQESIHQFRKLDQEVEIDPILEQLASLPPLDLDYSEETRLQQPLIVGGLSVALARTFRLLDPKQKTPHTSQWERAFRIFDLLL